MIANHYKCVGRLGEFEEDKELKAVMNMFWRQGYEGASQKISMFGDRVA